MKVLHVAQSLKGGPATYLNEIVPWQVGELGASNVALVVPRSDGSYLGADAHTESMYWFASRARDAASLLDLYQTTLRAVRAFQPDIIHLHSTFAGVVGRAAVWRRRPGVKVIYCAHGWAFERTNIGSLVRRVIIAVERLMARKTDCIVNISEHEARAARENGIVASANVTILNGVSRLPAVTASRKRELRQRLGMEEGRTNILFVGRYDAQKGWDTAAQVASQLPSRRFHLYSIGDAVVDGARTVPATNNITHLGWRTPEEIHSYMAAVDLLIMPSRWEGFGFVAVEAMRASTPVLGSNAGALPEIIVSGATGFLTTGKAADFLNVLQVTSNAQWAEMGTLARARYEQHFTRHSPSGLPLDFKIA